MSKKDFIALADMLRDYNKDAPNIGQPVFQPHQIELLADFCYQQNPDFKRNRWFGYINGENGPSGGKLKTSAAKS